jgi:hypothetical protein
VRKAVVGELDLVGVEARGFGLFADQKTLGDFELFEFRVAR